VVACGKKIFGWIKKQVPIIIIGYQLNYW